MNYVETPNAAAPTTRNVYSYVHIEPLLIGTIRSPYVSGVLGTEQFAYYATAPEGLPAAAYTFDRVTLATSEAWRAQWGPFGTILSETGSPATWRPPFRFQGQLELPRSDVSWWNGQTMFTSRQSVVHNRWRTYDPRVGQYLQPEPLLIEGEGVTPHPYSYVGLAPVDREDRTGRDWDDLVRLYCLEHPGSICNILLGDRENIPGTCAAPRAPRVPRPPFWNIGGPPPADCEGLYAGDIAWCRTRRTESSRAACYARASERYSSCLAGRRIPRMRP